MNKLSSMFLKNLDLCKQNVYDFQEEVNESSKGFRLKNKNYLFSKTF